MEKHQHTKHESTHESADIDGAFGGAIRSHRKKIYVIGSIVAVVLLLLATTIGMIAYTQQLAAKEQAAKQPVKPTYSAEVVAQASQLPKKMKTAIKQDLGLTPEAYVQQSVNAEQVNRTIEEVSAKNPAEFAGGWIDEDGYKHVAVTSEAVAATLPKDVRVNVVKQSDASLDKTQADFNTWVNTLDDTAKSRMVSVSKNYQDNRVEAVITKTNGQFGLEVPAEFDEKVKVSYLSYDDIRSGTKEAQPVANGYMMFADPAHNFAPLAQPFAALGGSVRLAKASGEVSARLAQVPPGFTDVDPSAIPGERMWMSLVKGGKPMVAACSLGFTGKSPQGQAIMLSSGHCALGEKPAGWPATLFMEGKNAAGATGYGTAVGAWAASKYGEKKDYGVVALAPQLQQKLAKGVVKTDSGNARLDGSYMPPVVGAPLCKAGATSGFTCGVIVSNKSTFIGAGALMGSLQMIDGFAATACVRAGDSGGPAFSGTKAVGINARVPTTNAIATVFGGGKSPCKKQQGGGFIDKMFKSAFFYPVAKAMQELPGYTLDAAQ
jgi:streptogrisin C